MWKLLPTALLALAGCAQNMVNVNITVYPDGSGEFEYAGYIPVRAAEGKSANPDGAFQSVHSLRSFHLSVRWIRGRFESLEKMAMSDVTFTFKDRVATVTFPPSRDSKWFGIFGATEEQTKLLNTIRDWDEEGLSENPSVVFAIRMPGKIEKNHIVSGKSTLVGVDVYEKDNVAYLSISVFSVRWILEKLVWEIHCGPTLDKVKEAWEAFKNPPKEPRRVKVQHILISWSGVKGVNSKLSKEDAEKKAQTLLEKLQTGSDFTDLMKAESDDKSAGVYTLVNGGETPKDEELARSAMVKSFGDASFKLEVGEVILVPYHEKKSPYGWHIIKRLE